MVDFFFLSRHCFTTASADQLFAAGISIMMAQNPGRKFSAVVLFFRFSFLLGRSAEQEGGRAATKTTQGFGQAVMMGEAPDNTL
jgi:hypothetical protein